MKENGERNGQKGIQERNVAEPRQQSITLGWFSIATKLTFNKSCVTHDVVQHSTQLTLNVSKQRHAKPLYYHSKGNVRKVRKRFSRPDECCASSRIFQCSSFAFGRSGLSSSVTVV